MTTYTICISAKGYVITVNYNGARINYFLKNEDHSLKDSYIVETVIQKKAFVVIGKEFGNNIHPIEIIAQKTVTTTITKNNIDLGTQRIAIWSYYRGLVQKNNKPQFIKQIAQEMRRNLANLGVEGVYNQLFIKNQLL